MARVCWRLMRFPTPKAPPDQPVFTSQHWALVLAQAPAQHFSVDSRRERQEG